MNLFESRKNVWKSQEMFGKLVKKLKEFDENLFFKKAARS